MELNAPDIVVREGRAEFLGVARDGQDVGRSGHVEVRIRTAGNGRCAVPANGGLGAVDGIQGPITTGAIKRFQADCPPLDVDGIVGPHTRGKLKEVYGC